MSIEEIIAIWSPLYTITPRDIEFLNKPVRSKFSVFNYGVYCGPFTPIRYSIGYETGKSYGDPIDSLDFICYLHDKFHSDIRSDEMMLRSIKVLNDTQMIGLNINGITNLVKIVRRLFNIWRIIH